MANNGPEKLIIDSIKKAGRVLIALPQSPAGDAVGAGLALFGFVRKLGKEAELICQSVDAKYRFLPSFSEVKSSFNFEQSFVVSLKTTAAKLDELSYEVKPDRVDIFLKPKSGGAFSPEDISFRSAKFPYDLIVTLNTPSLENLGAIYEKNTDLFFETPIINIDHHPNNEYYGQINHVDLTATSVSEILAALIEDFEASLIDENIATNLLMGIIVETNSFQHVKTTPRAFLRASSLITKGGKHQEIVRELYKTKQISLLKLWGRALARIIEVSELGLAYSLVNEQDLAKSGATAGDILGVMRELVANLSGQKIILFLAEIAPREVTGYFYLHPSLKAQIITSALGAAMLNGSLGTFKVSGSSLLEVEKDVLERLRKIKEQLAV